MKSLPTPDERVHKSRGLNELMRITLAIFAGIGVERPLRPVSLFKTFLRGPRVYKICCRVLMFVFPHKKKSQLSRTLDKYPENDHLQWVYSYTVTQDEIQITTGSNRRAERVYEILKNPPRDLSKERCLIVGGKNVTELFLAWVHGFSWGNLYAIDLFSLHPKIQVMDMDELEFESGYFNSVAMANVYGYQLDPFRCVEEIYRVLAPGGYFAFNSSYDINSALPVYRISALELTGGFRKIGFNICHHSSKRTGEESVSHLWCLQKPEPDQIDAIDTPYYGR